MLYAGDLVIDRSSGVVRRGDGQLNLTPIEFRLLVFFAQHLGRCSVARSSSSRPAGGYTKLILHDEKSVNTYIRRLREKIERDPSDPEPPLTVTGVRCRTARRHESGLRGGSVAPRCDGDRRGSLRWRLLLTYAGVATLTAVVLELSRSPCSARTSRAVRHST